MSVANNTVASVNYTGMYDNGEVFDTSDGKDPLKFTVGKGQMIRGFEEELIGAKPGETREFTLTPERAYGERNEEAVQTVKRSVLGEGAELKIGLSSYAQLQDGSMTMFTITAIDGDDVTLDFNHIMAGKTLTFTVTVTDVSEVDNCGPGCGCN